MKKSSLHVVPEAVSGAAYRRGRLGFAFGRTFFLALIVNLVWVGPAILHPKLFWGLVICDVSLVLLWLFDLLRLPAPSQVVLVRDWPHALLQASRGEVSLMVRNESKLNLSVDIVEDLAPELVAQPVTASIPVAAGSESTTTLPVFPLRRGDASVASTSIRYRSAWQLAERWAKADLPQTVRVFPRSSNATQQSLYLMQSRRLEVEKRFLKRKGIGREFECLREYREGDAFRDISWTATARRGKLVVKEHQIERSQPIWLVVDCGRLMRIRVDGLSNLDHATSAALDVAQVALFGGDRVGCMTYGLELQSMLVPGKGQAHLRLLMDRLALAREESAEANHLQAASRLLGAQSRRSLVIWLTDLADSAMTPDVIEGASRLLGRHLVIFAILQNTELVRLAQADPHDIESVYRWTAAQEVQQRREALLARLRSQGAHTLEVPPGGLSAAVVERYLHIKEKNLL